MLFTSLGTTYKMNFSDTIKASMGQVGWSPNGKFCNVVNTARLEIRDASSLQLFVTFNTSDTIQVFEWSSDSTLILTGNYKRGIVEVWNLNDLEWRCKIDEGSAGLIKAQWAPDSRHILCMADFNLRITVWSLVNKSVCYIKYPKEANPGMQFSPDHDYLAVAERKDCKDFISLFETKSWHLVKNFEVGTRDLAGLKWSSDNSVIVVWESPLEYRILVYTISGECLVSYSAYQWALGVRSCTWSPSAQFLAIGSYDQKIRLLNHITWRELDEFNHCSVIENRDCIIYKEVEKPLVGYPATLATVQGLSLAAEVVYEEEESRPVTLASVPSEPTKQGNPKVGISTMSFSSDGRYLASRNENMPATIWIWSIPKLSLSAILVHNNPIKEFAWSPRKCHLAICTGGNQLYFWTPFGCLTVAVPSLSALQINSLRWHPSGSQLAVMTKDQFSVCFVGCEERLIKTNEDLT